MALCAVKNFELYKFIWITFINFFYIDVINIKKRPM